MLSLSGRLEMTDAACAHRYSESGAPEEWHHFCAKVEKELGRQLTNEEIPIVVAGAEGDVAALATYSMELLSACLQAAR